MYASTRSRRAAEKENRSTGLDAVNGNRGKKFKKNKKINVSGSSFPIDFRLGIVGNKQTTSELRPRLVARTVRVLLNRRRRRAHAQTNALKIREKAAALPSAAVANNGRAGRTTK